LVDRVCFDRGDYTLETGTAWLWWLGGGVAVLSPVVNFVAYRIVKIRLAEVRRKINDGGEA
jgi:hypothetical protein